MGEARALVEALERGHDAARVDGVHLLPAKAHLLHIARADVLHEQVGLLQQLGQNLLALGRLHVQGEGLLVGVQLKIVQAPGIGDVQQGTEKLNGSISSSKQALGASIEKVDETYQMFENITQAAENATTVQTQINGVIDQSKQSLQTLCEYFERIKRQYQEVVTHINRASKLGTTKSTMFEDVDNMLSQIPEIVRDYTS